MEGSDAEENPIGTTNTSRISMPFGSGLVFCLSVKLDRKYLVNSKRQDLTPNVSVSEFSAKTSVDKKAYAATLLYLESKGEDTNRYYITKSGLDVTSGVYKFTLKHSSSFHDSNKLIINKSYKNGTVHYDVLSNQVIKFVR